MNPKEFPWTEDQQVTVLNPTDEDFDFKVHNKDYSVKAHKKVRMPGYIAWMFVYGISVRESQLTNVTTDEHKAKTSDFSRWNEEGFRATYYEKFYEGFDELVQEVEEEPEVEFEEVEDLEDENAVSQADLEQKELKTNGNVAIKPMKRKRGSTAKKQ